MNSLKLATLAVCSFGLTACGLADKMGASRAYNYATVLHSGEARGIGIGAEAPFRASRFSIGVEAGGFQDASDDNNVYALTHVDYDLIETSDRNPRIGGFIGFATDPERARRFDDRYPVIGNFLPFVGVQVTVPTFDAHEFRIRVSPGYSSETAVFSIQSNFVF